MIKKSGKVLYFEFNFQTYLVVFTVNVGN